MTDTHHKKQQNYFDKEFAERSTYHLAAWQISYIQKIKCDLLDKDPKKKTLLDIATGSGYIAIEMAKLGVNVIAIDISPQCIANLKRYKKKFKLTNLKLIECKAEKIPIRTRSVDYIVANAILEHIPNESRAVKEWRRILKPSGKIFITVPLRLRYVWPFLWPLNIFYDRRLGHIRRYDQSRLADVFNMNVSCAYYTGHLIKVCGALLSLITRHHGLDKVLERIDSRFSNMVYGASNISVILKNDS